MISWRHENIHSDSEYGFCSRCGRELYRYDEAYTIEGDLVCLNCATEDEAGFCYAETMNDRREDAYSIYLEELYESILQGD